MLCLSTTTTRSKTLVKTILPLLFALNFLYLFTYLLHHHHHHNNNNNNHHHRHLSHPNNHRHLRRMIHHHVSQSKPWPILPSYLPWSTPPHPHPHPQPHLKSCEGYFGNGFTHLADVTPRPTSSSSGWFRCYFSGTLRSSVCEGGRVRMDPGRIRMSRGGEGIEEVIGRMDDDELPVFEPGSFRVQVNRVVGGSNRSVNEEFVERYLPEGEILRHTMRELVGSVEFVAQNDFGFNCSEWIEEPTLLVTRFEYANVFHTYTDWYSAYVSSRVTGLPVRPNVVFVDGHSKTQLEETWKALFSGVRFAKNFSGPVCFRHAIFVPLGYETAWFKGLTESIDCYGASSQEIWANPNDRKTSRLSEFGEMIKAAFDLPVERQVTLESTTERNVLFVRREDYLAHPRHGGKVESRLSNEQEVFDSLQIWAANYTNCKVNLVNGLFAHMPMREQIRAIQDAYVIIGAHGAGLTHIVSALPKTVILEIISSQFRRPHFQLISQWKGLEYHAINLPGSDADPNEVVAQLERIMNSLGC